MCEHSSKVVTACGQNNSMSREVLLINMQNNITKGIRFPQSVHGHQNGLGMAVCADLPIHVSRV